MYFYLKLQIVFKYVEKTYHSFLNGADNFDDEEEEMARNIRKFEHL